MSQPWIAVCARLVEIQTGATFVPNLDQRYEAMKKNKWSVIKWFEIYDIHYSFKCSQQLMVELSKHVILFMFMVISTPVDLINFWYIC